MTERIRNTASVCPVCMKKLPAVLERDGEKGIFLIKTCPEHGTFRTAVRRISGLPEPDR